MRFYRLYGIVLLCILFVAKPIPLSAQDKIKQGPKSNWIEAIDFIPNTIVNNGPYNYLLADKQENTRTEEKYFHYVIQLNTSEGVQEESSVSLVYDPKYQQAIVHDVLIHRDGKTIKKGIDGFQLLQRETDLQRSLYDGRISAVNELGDIRVGDVLEYSYTIKGYNPLLSQYYSRELDLEFSLPIDRLYYKIVSPLDLKLTYVKDAQEATITESDGMRSYVWDLKQVKSNFGSSVSPSWQENYKTVIITSFDDWEEVVGWAQPLYVVPQEEKSRIKKELLDDFSFDGSETELIQAIRFVQDNIRYLGFEEGVNAYKPYKPTKILDQRFGDCKDKSLLLTTILNLMGVKAYPMLVHSYDGGNIINQPPSPNAFDHCIVQFEYEGTDYQVDPTISSQGGNIENITIPNYDYGLVIEDRTTALSPIRKNIVPLYQVDEEIIMDSIGGGAVYKIVTTCKGNRADSQRDYFNSTNRDNISDSYQKFYSDLYPSISIDTIYVVDSSRATNNNFISHERYNISPFWEEIDDDIIGFQISPIILWEYVNYDETTEKNVHYQLGNPIEYIQSTKLVFPEEWNIVPSTKSIKNDYFDYTSSLSYSNNTAYFKYRYYLKKNYIEAGDVQATLSDFEELQEDLNFDVTYNLAFADSGNRGTNYLLLFVAFLSVIGGAYMMWLIYKQYDPPSKHSTVYHSLGGWLVLPAIGLSLSPLMLLISYYQLSLEGGYDWNTWEALWTNDSVSNGKSIVIMIVIETILNCLLLLYTILVVILFYKRRTIAPILIVALYIISFLYPLTDAFIANSLTETSDPIWTTDMLKGFLAMCIWGPYFLISKRVKTTFTQTLHIPENPISTSEEE